MKKTKPKLLATLANPYAGLPGYRHVAITLYQIDPAFGSETELLTGQWQCDSDGTCGGAWYAGRVTVEASGYDHARVIGDAARFLTRHPVTDDPRAWLESTGIPVAVYDRRTSRRQPVDSVPALDVRRWMVRGSDGCCWCAALADSEDGARRQLLKEAAGYAADHPGRYAAEFQAWMAAGQPVELDSYATPPELPDLDVIFSTLVPVAKAA